MRRYGEPTMSKYEGVLMLAKIFDVVSVELEAHGNCLHKHHADEARHAPCSKAEERDTVVWVVIGELATTAETAFRIERVSTQG